MENLLRIKNGREAYEINPSREKERKTERRALISFITQYIQIPIVHIYIHKHFYSHPQSTSIENALQEDGAVVIIA